MKVEKNNLLYFQFEKFLSNPSIVSAFFSRFGGVSKFPFEGLNLGLHVKDNGEDVLQNRKLVLKELGFTSSMLISMEQIHSDNLSGVSLLHKGRGAYSWDDAIPATDGMVSRDKGILLMALVADCSVVVFYDPLNEAIGIGHCGWRGTVKKLSVKIINEMSMRFGSRPSDLLAGISPCIGPCCCEVGMEVKEMFLNSFGNVSESFFELSNGKIYLDIQKSLVYQLISSGVKEENIDIIKLCTSCRTDIFYSHRREKGITGRNAVFIGMRDI